MATMIEQYAGMVGVEPAVLQAEVDALLARPEPEVGQRTIELLTIPAPFNGTIDADWRYVGSEITRDGAVLGLFLRNGLTQAEREQAVIDEAIGNVIGKIRPAGTNQSAADPTQLALEDAMGGINA